MFVMNAEKLGRWGMALGFSVGLHVVILIVLMQLGKPGQPTGQVEVPSTDGRAEAMPGERTPDPVAEAARIDSERAAEAQKAKPEKPRPPKVTTKPAAEKKTEAVGEKKAEGTRKSEISKKSSTSTVDRADEWTDYEVKAGDSLTKLAKRCGCTVQEMAKANGLKPTANLALGQKIKIKSVQ